MRRLRLLVKGLLYSIGVLLMLLLIGFSYLYIVAQVDPPDITDRSAENLRRREVSPGFFTLGPNWFRKSRSGLYELYVEGNDFERGVINGKLTGELVRRQEDHFAAQIEKMIPSSFYRHFLKYFIGWFNRKLPAQVKEEYKREIYGISLSASDKYGYIGKPYQRLLNYHAAHDIGHALQSMALVGCTSFATWDGHSADSNLIIGRNFDFYVGDKFAEDKIVAFMKPANGYGYMTVTWGGFTGAVSGMNEKGLTVTINAAKTAMPSGSATPVSLVAREILQYAADIKEALAIANSRHMFVSESFLVGSAADNKAVVIEKTPDSLDVYDPHRNYIICANHFQSPKMLHSPANEQQMKESASPYRYERVEALLQQAQQNTVRQTVAILRDYKGNGGTDIGLGNEKAINQLIAHHSIVFEPKKRRVWVSTAPWQLGPFRCYDLNKVFSLRGMQVDQEIADSSLTIPADSLLFSPRFADFERFRSYRQRLLDGGHVAPDSIVTSNPTYYHSYVLAGQEARYRKDYTAALAYYRKALTLEIATAQEKKAIEKAIADCLKLSEEK
ncbi:C45 family autoproteolytic acyltransferase/hydolase [Flavihumibacter petaseus]|uniref:Peptidase C45 family protein n=1 Tax=Flavihumibacter petaseus NBRC 106054 TaxID=1220578 RepID=A0A0E9MY91_9BACT|nr:C45 family peptidase [Flavihumibacter petaseus]GAO42100.1 peptidase C45 family protein [Flavihumibacter petaseus NBRC 106054]